MKTRFLPRAFCGYGVAVSDFRHPPVDWKGRSTYIQRSFYLATLAPGIYELTAEFAEGVRVAGGRVSASFAVAASGTTEPTDPTKPSAGSMADRYEPRTEPEIIEEGEVYDLTDNVTNLADLPPGVIVEDVTEEGAIHVDEPGIYTGKVKISYPDGSYEIVEVRVEVVERIPIHEPAQPTKPVKTPKTGESGKTTTWVFAIMALTLAAAFLVLRVYAMRGNAAK